MKKNVPTVKTSVSRDLVTEELAKSESVEASLMAGTTVDGGSLTPIESAILSMDKDLQSGMTMIKEIKRLTDMLETAFKLMTYELGVIAKNYPNVISTMEKKNE